MKLKPLQQKIISFLISSLFALTGLVCLGFYFTYDPTRNIKEYIPGMDGRPPSLSSSSQGVRIGEFFRASTGIPSSLPGSWPRFRGADYDNIVKANISLNDSWDEDGPGQLWSVDLGEGHAAPAVANGRVYVLDYDETQKADALRCFSLDDGKEIWRRWYRIMVKRNHGMSRTIPAVGAGHVVTIGPRCHVMCVTAEEGDLAWGLDLQNQYNTTEPLWYTGQCPLIDDTQAVIAPGGDALLIGVNLADGEVVWQTANPWGWKMSHSSIIKANILGADMYIYAALGGVVGVSAQKETRGQLLWHTTAWSPSVVTPSPVCFSDGRILLTAGYGAGSMMLKLNRTGRDYEIRVLYEKRPNQGLATEQQTPLLYNGYLYSIMPKDGGELRNQFVCYTPGGDKIWSSGKENLFGLGPYMIADNKFFILNDDGVLTMARVSQEAFIKLAQAKVLPGPDAWGPLAMVGSRLLLRDSRRMICLDLNVE